MWIRLARITIPHEFSLATLRGHVLAIGGTDESNPTGAIHCYDVATNSWSVIGEMPTARSEFLTAVLPSNQLVVVGGRLLQGELCSITETCNS
jgi:N-acetylneuraminic acid mutarotase